MIKIEDNDNPFYLANKIIDTQKQNINKLITYIATKENKDFEQVRKEFGIV